MNTIEINAEGQITIPPAIRDRLGFLPGTEVHLEIVGDTLEIRRKSTSNRGIQLVATMRGKATSKLRTDEIMQLTRFPT